MILAFAVFAVLPRSLNLLTLGEDVAAGRGVEVLRAQRWSFLSASMATGAAVSLGGPIGFIGIIVPHLVRLMVGSDHRLVLPAAAFFGAAFTVLCDLVARTAMAPLELPIGHYHGDHRRTLLPLAAGEEVMNRSRTLVFAVALAVASITGVGQERPSRIISLVPALTEMLFAIGAGPQTVAVSSYDEFPPEVNRLPKVGALVDPDMERILALTPDLVLTYGSQSDVQTQLSRAGIAFFDYRHGGLAHVTTTMRALGERTGHADEAERVAAPSRRGSPP